MERSNAKLLLRSGRKRATDWLRRLIESADGYPLRRRIFNAQRAHRHPATMTAARRRKLRGN